MIVEDTTITVTIKPAVACINPVFELLQAPKTLVRVRLADRLLEAKEYAWDGKTLWIKATVLRDTPLRLEFGPS